MKNLLTLKNGLRVDSFGKSIIVSTDSIKVVFDEDGNFVSIENTNAFIKNLPANGTHKKSSNFQMAKNFEIEVSDELLRLGVPKNLKGYNYLREAILLAYYDPTYLEALMSRLYVDIGKKHNVAPANVERAIRHSIKVACSRSEKELLQKTFGRSYDLKKGKVINSEFISTLVDKFRLENV